MVKDDSGRSGGPAKGPSLWHFGGSRVPELRDRSKISTSAGSVSVSLAPPYPQRKPHSHSHSYPDPHSDREGNTSACSKDYILNESKLRATLKADADQFTAKLRLRAKVNHSSNLSKLRQHAAAYKSNVHDDSLREQVDSELEKRVKAHDIGLAFTYLDIDVREMKLRKHYMEVFYAAAKSGRDRVGVKCPGFDEGRGEWMGFGEGWVTDYDAVEPSEALTEGTDKPSKEGGEGEFGGPPQPKDPYDPVILNSNKTVMELPTSLRLSRLNKVKSDYKATWITEIHNEGVLLRRSNTGGFSTALGVGSQSLEGSLANLSNGVDLFIPWGLKARQFLYDILTGYIPRNVAALHLHENKTHSTLSKSPRAGLVKCLVADMRTSYTTASNARSTAKQEMVSQTVDEDPTVQELLRDTEAAKAKVMSAIALQSELQARESELFGVGDQQELQGVKELLARAKTDLAASRKAASRSEQLLKRGRKKVLTALLNCTPPADDPWECDKRMQEVLGVLINTANNRVPKYDYEDAKGRFESLPEGCKLADKHVVKNLLRKLPIRKTNILLRPTVEFILQDLEAFMTKHRPKGWDPKSERDDVEALLLRTLFPDREQYLFLKDVPQTDGRLAEWSNPGCHLDLRVPNNRRDDNLFDWPLTSISPRQYQYSNNTSCQTATIISSSSLLRALESQMSLLRQASAPVETKLVVNGTSQKPRAGRQTNSTRKSTAACTTTSASSEEKETNFYETDSIADMSQIFPGDLYGKALFDSMTDNKNLMKAYMFVGGRKATRQRSGSQARAAKKQKQVSTQVNQQPDSLDTEMSISSSATSSASRKRDFMRMDSDDSDVSLLRRYGADQPGAALLDSQPGYWDSEWDVSQQQQNQSWQKNLKSSHGDASDMDTLGDGEFDNMMNFLAKTTSEGVDFS